MNGVILAIDPGNVQSAWLIYDSNEQVVRQSGIQPNEEILKMILRGDFGFYADAFVLEQIASFGMAVGETVFETVFWSGRFAQAWGREFHRVKRHEVKMHICKHPRAKDANIRQALIDKFGPPGTKKAPGKTYGISKDLWAALAVAVTFAETREKAVAA